VDSIDFHYTASPIVTSVQAIAQYQIGPTAQADFPAIAYHIIIDSTGKFYYTQDLDRRVWHNGAPGRNERAIGICYTGDVRPTPKQIDGLKEARLWCERQLKKPLVKMAHNTTYATSCPGPYFNEWKNSV